MSGRDPRWMGFESLSAFEPLLDPAFLQASVSNAGMKDVVVERTGQRLNFGPTAVISLRLKGTSTEGEMVEILGYILCLPHDRLNEAAAKCEKLRSVPSPLGPGVVRLPGQDALLFLFPNDRHLRGLRFIATMDKVKRTLADLPFLSDGGYRVRGRRSLISPVRWKPERRYIARAFLDLKNDQTGATWPLEAHLRYFADPRGESLLRTTTALREAGLERAIPEPLGALVDGHLYVERTVTGPTLMASLGDEEVSGTRLGETLSSLHRCRATLQQGAGPLARLETSQEFLRTLLPMLQGEEALVLEIKSRLNETLPAAGTYQRMPTHGDLHPSQVIFGTDGPVLIDFERSALDDPLLDLGNFVANLDALGLSDGGLRRGTERIAGEFLEGARESLLGRSPSDLAWHRANSLIHLALLPWRRGEEDAPTKSLALLRAAALGLRASGPCGPTLKEESVAEGREPMDSSGPGFFRSSPADPRGYEVEVFYLKPQGPWPGVLGHPSGSKLHGLYDPLSDGFTEVRIDEDPVLSEAYACIQPATLVSYRPTQRAVVRRRVGEGTEYVKLLPPQKVVRILERHERAREHAARTTLVTIANETGGDLDRGLLRFAPLRGRSLYEILRDPMAPGPEVFERLGRALAEWHRPPEDASSFPRPPKPIGPATWLGLVAPHLDHLRPLFDSALEALPRLEPASESVVVHGDLHDKNVFLEVGVPGIQLLDLDLLHAGDPVIEIANLAAHVTLAFKESGQGNASAKNLVREMLRAYRDAGGMVPRSKFENALAHHHFRLACIHVVRRRTRGFVSAMLKESIRCSQHAW